MIFKAVGDSRPYADHGFSVADWAKVSPRHARVLDLDALQKMGGSVHE